MTALLWLTHVWSPDLAAEFEKLSAIDGMETWLLLDSRTPGADVVAQNYPRCHILEKEALFRLPYPRLATPGLIGHVHFVVLDFFLSHRQYDKYWFVEYDVRYTGSWSSLFASFREFDHDLVTSHIRRFAEEPHWPWWKT